MINRPICDTKTEDVVNTFSFIIAANLFSYNQSFRQVINSLASTTQEI